MSLSGQFGCGGRGESTAVAGQRIRKGRNKHCTFPGAAALLQKNCEWYRFMDGKRQPSQWYIDAATLSLSLSLSLSHTHTHTHTRAKAENDRITATAFYHRISYHLFPSCVHRSSSLSYTYTFFFQRSSSHIRILVRSEGQYVYV